MDSDGDGFGDAAIPIDTCASVAPMGYVADNTDCDDNNALINPDALEVLDSLDNDCNGLVDDGIVGVNDLSWPLEIFPNPVKDILTIEGVASGEVIIRILDLNGRLVQQEIKRFDQQRTTVQLAPFPRGVYLLMITDKEGEKRVIRRLVRG